MKQGERLSADQIARIVRLLKFTDMTMADIALATRCTRTTVSRLNQDHGIRLACGMPRNFRRVESQEPERYLRVVN